MSIWINGYSIDPSGYLSMGCAEDWDLPCDLTETEVGMINDAIYEWVEADPDGYDDAEARRLDERVFTILESRR